MSLVHPSSSANPCIATKVPSMLPLSDWHVLQLCVPYVWWFAPTQWPQWRGCHRWVYRFSATLFVFSVLTASFYFHSRLDSQCIVKQILRDRLGTQPFVLLRERPFHHDLICVLCISAAIRCLRVMRCLLYSYFSWIHAVQKIGVYSYSSILTNQAVCCSCGIRTTIF